MSSGAGGVVAGVFGMGVIYLLAVAAVNVMLFAAFGAAIVIAVAVGILFAAIRGWSKSLRAAKANGDVGWMFDLIAVPLMGVILARTAGTWFADWLTVKSGGGRVEFGPLDLTGGSDGAFINIFVGLLGIGAFFLWLYLLVAIPTLLANRDSYMRRFVGYPAFAFYATFYGGYAIALVWIAQTNL